MDPHYTCFVCMYRQTDGATMYKLGGWVSVLQQQQQRWVCQYGTLWEAPSSLSTVGGDANNNKKSIVVQFVN